MLLMRCNFLKHQVFETLPGACTEPTKGSGQSTVQSDIALHDSRDYLHDLQHIQSKICCDMYSVV